MVLFVPGMQPAWLYSSPHVPLVASPLGRKYPSTHSHASINSEVLVVELSRSEVLFAGQSTQTPE